MLTCGCFVLQASWKEFNECWIVVFATYTSAIEFDGSMNVFLQVPVASLAANSQHWRMMAHLFRKESYIRSNQLKSLSK